MANAALALTQPNINPVGAYLGAQQAALDRRSQRMQQDMAGIQVLASGAMATLGGDLNGQVDPNTWETFLTDMERTGTDVSALRGKPEMARTIALSGMTAMEQLQLARSDRDYELALKKFEFDLQQADQQGGYTLSPGQVRFGADNQPVATGLPDAPDGQSAKDIFGFETSLWQQYAASDPVKTYEAVKGGFERVRESAGQATGAGDLGLIYGYMRMLDPGSVVRESEFALAAQAGDFGEQIQGMVSRLMNGERLPESQRREFVAAAEQLYGEVDQNLRAINEQFTTRAGAVGVDPSRVIREPEQFEPLFPADQPVVPSGDLPQPKSAEEYAALPPGTQYLDPSGVARTKQ